MQLLSNKIIVLLQVICISKQSVECIVEQLLKFPAQNIVLSVRQNLSILSFFRLLFVEKNQSEKLTQLARRIQSDTTNADNALSLILNQYLQMSEKQFKMCVDEEEQKMVKVLPRCNTDDPHINEALSNMSNLGEKLSKLLLNENFEPEKSGLLVDWLSAVELEIVSLKEGKENVEVIVQFLINT